MLVRLVTDWTAPDGTEHRAGDLVEVDAATLAQLEDSGHVSTDGQKDPVAQPTGWVDPSGADPGTP